MTQSQINKSAWYFIFAVTVYTAAHLLWEILNGGVVRHHLLNRADMPAVSNWWGMVILPGLAWFASTRMKKRLTVKQAEGLSIPKHIKFGFVGILLLSLLQSFAFKLGVPSVTLIIALAILIGGVFLPIYRAECFLAHVMGGCIAFGSVIPLIGFTIMALVSALANLVVKPLLVKLVARIKKCHE